MATPARVAPEEFRESTRRREEVIRNLEIDEDVTELGLQFGDPIPWEGRVPS